MLMEQFPLKGNQETQDVTSTHWGKETTTHTKWSEKLRHNFAINLTTSSATHNGEGTPHSQLPSEEQRAWAPPLVPQLLCPALSASAFPSLDLNRAPLSSILITGDRIQDKLPQNMTHWHTEGLELKESEK